VRRLQRGILRRASEGEPVKLDDAVIAAAKGRRSYVTSRVRTSWPAKGDVAAEVETPRTRLSAGRYVFRWGGRRDGCVWGGNFRPAGHTRTIAWFHTAIVVAFRATPWREVAR